MRYLLIVLLSFNLYTNSLEGINNPNGEPWLLTIGLNQDNTKGYQTHLRYAVLPLNNWMTLKYNESIEHILQRAYTYEYSSPWNLNSFNSGDYNYAISNQKKVSNLSVELHIPIYKIWGDYIPLLNEKRKQKIILKEKLKKECPYKDCNGDCNGNAKLDECGVCGGSGIAKEGECDCDGNILDCKGICGGDSKMHCGICSDSNDNGNCDDMNILKEIMDINPQLKTLDVYDIATLKWHNDGRLAYLKIINSNLEFLPESIKKLNKLDELILDNNNIKQLPSSICLLSNKTYISVAKNKLCNDYLFDCINYSRKQDQSDCP